jgi:UDP-N-acetylglucosamine--N-acetylmuramyl-(pentapeptide) pyrophosphoryl-undecaprenol N-acetylglucosamine transferase
MPGGPARVVFAGGGTGGTVGPGVAIAERLRDLDPSLEIRFLVSDRPVDRLLLDPGEWPFDPTPARSPSVRPAAAWRFVRGWRGTRRIAASRFGDADRCRVVALGGFVAPPVVAEAVRRGVPVDLLNLDAVAGRANRWIAARAARVFTAVETDLDLAAAPVGVPLRRAVLATASPDVARRGLGLAPDRRTLLVTGASQGARSIDRFMLDLLGDRPAMFDGWQVVHLAGGDIDRISRAYADAGVAATVLPFLDTMGMAWSAADLAISRGGASSVAEIAASITPAIILPYPWHKDRHQARNAAPLEACGAVVVLDDPVSGDDAVARLRTTLGDLLAEPVRLDAMQSAFPTPPEDPAARLAQAILGH